MSVGQVSAVKCDPNSANLNNAARQANPARAAGLAVIVEVELRAATPCRTGKSRKCQNDVRKDS